MKKERAFIDVSLKNVIAYRAEVWYWFVLNLIPLFVTAYLWLAVYKDSKTVAGYTLSMMVTYYLVIFFIRRVSSAPTFWLSELIQQGGLSAFLLKPYGFIKYAFIQTITNQLSSFILSLPLIALVMYLLRSYLMFPISFIYVLLFIVSVVISIFLSLIIGLLLGSIAFWVTETGSLFYSYSTIVGFLGGGALPLDMFPSGVRTILYYLPFQYLFNFPLQVYLGDLTLVQVFDGLLLGFVWLVLFSILLNIVWRRGLRVYGAYGG